MSGTCPWPGFQVLLLPGWQNSGPGHWQSHWEEAGWGRRVEQSDWDWPRRGDWSARLDETLLDLQDPRPVVLVAHSLGCHLVAAWAGHSRLVERVHAALLVAPPDLTRPELPPALQRWTPPRLQPLALRAMVVLSSDDPYCGLEQGLAMAQAWGTPAHVLGAHGHVNAESALGLWPEGQGLLQALLQGQASSPPSRPESAT